MHLADNLHSSFSFILKHLSLGAWSEPETSAEMISHPLAD